MENNLEKQQNENKIQNDLIEIELNPELIKINISPIFKNIINKSNYLSQQAQRILEITDINLLNDEDITALIKEIGEIKSYDKKIEDALKEVRKQYDNQKDHAMTYLKSIINYGNTEKLDVTVTNLKILEKNIKNKRKEIRWDTLSQAYYKYLSNFPILIEKLPNLVNFNRFKSEKENLMSGAQNWKITDNIKSEMFTYINSKQEKATTIEALNSQFKNELYEYTNANNPEPSQIIEHNNVLRERAEQFRIEQEKRIKQEALLLVQKKEQEKQNKIIQEQNGWNKTYTTTNINNQVKQITNQPFKKDITTLTNEVCNYLYNTQTNYKQFNQEIRLNTINLITKNLYEKTNKSQGLINIIKTTNIALDIINEISKK